MLVDDLGHPFTPHLPALRVVSLVPSLTEALAGIHPDRVVGATDWCTHPPDLDTTRVRGTKNPDLAAIAALEPDVVVVNQEENRELDVRRLRDAGIQVWVTVIESVPQSLASMRRLITDALGWAIPAWLQEAEQLWAEPLPDRGERVVVPVWRDPWMVVGRDTFTGDLLERLGYTHAYANHADRYPKVDCAEIDRSDLVVLLPDEPYVFTDGDGPEAFHNATTRLVSGRLITWYGPSLVAAYASLERATSSGRRP